MSDSKIKIQPHPLTYFMSVLFGQFLIFIVLIAFLRFSHGNILTGFVLAIGASVLLSLFLAWVDIEEVEDEKNAEQERRQKRFAARGRA